MIPCVRFAGSAGTRNAHAARTMKALVFSLVVLAGSTACTSSDGGATTGVGPAGDGGAGGGVDAATTGGFAAGGSPGMDTKPTVIYAHTDTTLFQLDPSSPTLALTPIGDFDCIGTATGQYSAMTDFAVNANLELWGISGHDVHPLTIEGSTVHCGAPIVLHQDNVRFYGLTFAPAGVLDAEKEVLVAGNTAGELWSIDPSGNLQQRGILGNVPNDDGNGHAYANPGKTWELSGDIVFLANGGDPIGFAMVRDCPNPPDTAGCDSVNTLLEIDVPKLGTATTNEVTKAVRGQIVEKSSCGDGKGSAYGNMYGIAAWNDKVFGFSRSGNLVEIDTSDATGCLVQSYAADHFAGAGVTTNAPVVAPEPK